MDDETEQNPFSFEENTSPNVHISESLKIEISALYPALRDRGVLHVMSNEERLMTLRLPVDQTTSVGRSAHATFPIQHDPTLSRLHFVVKHEEESCFVLETRSTTRPTFHNGAEVRGHVLLAPGDEITAGLSRFLFEIERFVEEPIDVSAFPSLEPPSSWVEDEVEAVYLIPEPMGAQPIVALHGCESVLMGRSSTADVHLDESSVSGKHCILRRVPSWSGEGAYTIEDLASRNGTTIQRFGEGATTQKLGAHPQRLEHGMKICLGETITYRFATRVNRLVPPVS